MFIHITNIPPRQPGTGRSSVRELIYSYSAVQPDTKDKPDRYAERDITTKSQKTRDIRFRIRDTSGYLNAFRTLIQQSRCPSRFEDTLTWTCASKHGNYFNGIISINTHLTNCAGSILRNLKLQRREKLLRCPFHCSSNELWDAEVTVIGSRLDSTREDADSKF